MDLASIRSALNAPDSRTSIDLVEALLLAGVLGIASIGTCSLALAQFGSFSTSVAVVGGVAGFVTVLAIACAVGGVPRLHLDGRTALLAALTALLAAYFFFPGFPYAFADKDPGVYVAHAFGIERTGALDIPDEAATVAFQDPRAEAPSGGVGGRYPGFRVEDFGAPVTTSTDFFHFVPSLFATAIGVGGTAGVFNITPLMGAMSLLAVALALNRAIGPGVAVVTVGLLAMNMAEVWQAKTPSTEIPMQMVVGSALLCIVLAGVTRWRGAAFLAGVLVGTSFVIRPDGFLVVALGAGLIGLLIAADVVDGRLAAGVGGTLLVLPYAFHTAYVRQANYVAANGVPPMPVLVAACVAAVIGGLLVRALAATSAGASVRRRLARFDWRIAGGALAFLVIIGGIVAWNRESWFGITFGSFAGSPIRTYDERNLLWLSYYFTVPGLFLAVAGLAVLGIRRRWNGLAWLLVIPGMAVLPIYLYEARISPRLMWWVRRFVPLVVPALVILIAVAIVWLLTRRSIVVMAAGVLTLAVLVQSWSSTSRPLRGHRELAGSYDAVATLAGATEDAAIVLVHPGGGIVGATRNLPAVAWLRFDIPSTYLPREALEVQSFVDGWDEATDGPVYVFTETEELPDGLDESEWTQVIHEVRRLPFWYETTAARPTYAIEIGLRINVYRYEPLA